jgi:hypothetical protein
MGFQLNGGFNASEVKDDRDGIPAGTYLCVISDTTEKQTKRGDASYAEFTFDVVEGEHKGRKIWDRLNLNNPNPKTVEIAMQQLRRISMAVGKPIIADTSELCDIPLLVTVRYVDKGGEFGPEARLSFAPAGATPQASRPAAANQSARPAAAANSKPWERSRA